MRKTVIAFDVDGTLLTNVTKPGEEPRVNERIRTLLVILSSFKNTQIIVWSGGGELWARQAARIAGVEKYVDKYGDKNHLGKDEHGNHIFQPDLQPDIAIDDIQACKLGIINLIVREK